MPSISLGTNDYLPDNISLSHKSMEMETVFMKVKTFINDNIYKIIVGVLILVILYLFRLDIRRLIGGPQYVMMKGYEGLGDRWQVLIQVIEYARCTGRIIVCDWRDHMWSNGKSYDFDNYLKIVGVKFISLRKFKDRFNATSMRMSVTPPIWSGAKLLDGKYGGEIYEDKYNIVGGDGGLQGICDGKMSDFTEDVVVYLGLKGRTHFWDRFRFVKMTDNTKKVIKSSPIIKKLRPVLSDPQGKYITIHMRGGDRVLEKYKNGSSDKEAYVKELISDLNGELDERKIKHVAVLSDSEFLINEFNKQFSTRNGQIKLYYSNVPKLDKKINEYGLHKIPKEELKKSKLSKQTILNNNFIDFYVLLMADKVICDSISNFSNVATHIQGSFSNDNNNNNNNNTRKMKRRYSMGLNFS